MRLVIVESPAKCSKIQGFLGLGYKVIASMGHIRALAHDLDAVGLQKNFEPTYEFMKEKATTISKLKAEAKGAESIILCADDDREGEAIAYSIAVLLKLNVNTNPRAAFREITKNAILDAIQNPRTLDMNRVHSQQARAMLDLMIGFTISPLLWKHLGGQAALSAGRCQTPALRLVCEKEALIDAFKSESSWAISGTWSAAGSKAKWPAALIDPLGDDESALNYLENHKDDPSGIIRKAVTKPWTESPPQALMTSTLQQQVSNLYKCAPKRCMQIAQKLYEAGHITYMRTDQVTMSEEAVKQAKKIVEAKWGKQYLALQGGSKKQKVEGAQEAHEAIRPTHFERGILPQTEDWGDQDKKIYRLIWLRSLQSVMAQAKGEHRLVDFEAEGDGEDFPWQAKWKRTTFPGWKAADEKESQINLAQDDEQETEEDAAIASWAVAEELKVGQTVSWSSLLAKPQETKAQGRFTEATLVRELEKKGIGRPSTFASLIATIVEKGYVEVKDIPATSDTLKALSLKAPGQWPPTEDAFLLKRGGEKARLLPTPLGRTLLDFVLEKFPDLFSFSFTAGMETRLDKVAEGDEPWKKVLEDTWSSYKDRYESLKSNAGGTAGATGSNPKRREFGENLVAVMTAKGPLLLKEAATKEETVFFGWPAKRAFKDVTAEEAKAFVTAAAQQKQGDQIGEYNGHPVVLKNGQYGTYAECNGVRVSLGDDKTLEHIVEKLQLKAENPSRSVGPFQIRTGQYGPYLMKAPAKGGKPQCISIPKEIDLETLTAQQAGEIFEAGLKSKAAFAKRKFKQNKN